MRLVIIESPYAGDVERNVAYARACMADSLARGEAPIASHLLYIQPGVLDDAVAGERELGIRAGLAWRAVADAAVFYVDLGWSDGMRAAAAVYTTEGRAVEHRTIRRRHDDIARYHRDGVLAVEPPSAPGDVG